MDEKKRLNILIVLLCLAFVVLWGQLFCLQIVQGKESRRLADENRILKDRLVAPRGLILDRNGETLAQDGPLYLLKQNDGAKKEINREEALDLQEKKQDANLEIKWQRQYPQGGNFAHLVGYLNEVTETELAQKNFNLKGYGIGDVLGRTGVELQYEKLLKGHDGSGLAEVDTRGKTLRQVGQILPSPGKSLTLAIDSRLQKIAVEQMKDRKGAIVATNPMTGEILIFYSSPSFDPNLFLTAENQNKVAKLITDEENRPLFNRVITGLYAPGSTFKIVTSIAGLEEGKISGETKILDTGVLTVGDFKYNNWYFTQYGRTEGEVNLVKAFSRSTDTYFYKVGEFLGADNLIKWTKKFGLDNTFGVDLPSEAAGFIASPEWKQKTKNEAWFLGNTYHLAIGQGDLDLTPLGVNLMTAVVANNGKICTPRVLKIGAENTPYQAECKEIGIKKENLDLVRKGMIAACSTGGTGYPFFDFKPQVACKTGTAETGDGKTSHAWFTVMAPAYAEATAGKPEIVLTVLVEKGGEGSSVSAPIAKEILREFFKK